jgi:tetratricopeptide (TPR) repeat protein
VFYERIHALHLAAEQPSMRQLQRRTRSPQRPTGINPTTIHDVFCRPRLSRWEVVQEVVRQLGGDVEEFAGLWRRAWDAERTEGNAERTEGNAERPDQGERPGARPTHGAPVPRQLPADTLAFTGRDDALLQLARLLEPDRGAGEPGPVTAAPLAVVTGCAGVGKTALVVHWAQRVRARFPDGQLFADLRGYSPGAPVRPAEALGRFLRALGVAPGEIPADPDAAAGLYRSVLADRRVLVVLDNAADAEQVRPLVPGHPDSLVVVTSRDRLSGLVARDGARRIVLDVLAPRDAERLLTHLIGADRVAGEVDALAVLARICSYLPLALRVAAADISDHPRQRIVEHVARIGERGGVTALDIADPQAAVEAAFDLSYRRLSAETRRVFRLLGLVPGTDVGVAVAAALAGVTLPEGQRQLDRLAAAHLVVEHLPGRYTWHDLFREYAVARAREEPEAGREAARRRMHGWYLRQVDAAARVMYPQRVRLSVPVAEADAAGPDTAGPDDGLDPAFPGYPEALAWLDTERQNLGAVIRVASREAPEVAWLLADSLRGYFWIRMSVLEWENAARSALHAARTVGDVRAEAAALLGLGDIHHRQDDFDRAVECYQGTLALAERAGWVEGQAAALGNLGSVYRDHGLVAESVDVLGRSLGLYREIGSGYGEAVTLDCIGRSQRHLGRFSEAEGSFRRALELYQEAGSTHGEALVLHDLGELAHSLGRLTEARAHLVRGLDLARRIEDRGVEADVLCRLAAVRRDEGGSGEAVELAERAEALFRRVGDRIGAAFARQVTASVRHRDGRYAEAVAGYQDVLGACREIGEPLLESETLLALATAFEETGDLARARSTAVAARTAALRTGCRPLVAQADAVLDRFSRIAPTG